MSDFDKYFAERLDEEGQFPRREKNWKAVSKRLEAFDAGISGRSSRMRYWQAAAAASIIAVSVLFGKVYRMHRENTGLREQIANLQKNSAGSETHSSADVNAPQKETTPVLAPVDVVQQDLTAWPKPQSERTENGTTASMPENLSRRFSSKKTKSTAEKQNQAEQNVTQPNPIAVDDLANMNSPEQSAGQPQPVDGQTTDQTKNGLAHPQRGMDQLALLPVNIAALKPVTATVAAIKTVPVNTPVIKPVSHHFSTFRAGVQASVGLPSPREKGVSPFIGAGVSAEYAFWRNLRLGVSADWLRNDINADTLLGPRHFPQYPPKPKPGHNLTQIEGSRRSQQYSLGIAYTIPLHFPVKPAVRIAHTWTHLSPAIYSLRFDKKPPHFPPGPSKPEFEPVKSESEWVSNHWRVGAGLEFETPRWVAGVWADYSKGQASNGPVSDAVFIRAGVSYKFD
jgi:hypothetical protein